MQSWATVYNVGTDFKLVDAMGLGPRLFGRLFQATTEREDLMMLAQNMVKHGLAVADVQTSQRSALSLSPRRTAKSGGYRIDPAPERGDHPESGPQIWMTVEIDQPWVPWGTQDEPVWVDCNEG